MAYKLEVDHPDFPKDWEFDCDGIAVKNKGSVAVTEEMEQAFLSKNGRSIKEIYGHSEVVKLSGTSELSPKKSGGEG